MLAGIDARLLRHCTAIPTINLKKNGKRKGEPETAAYGTYFGIDKRFENKLVKMKAIRLADEAAARAKAKAQRRAEQDAINPPRKVRKCILRHR